jgi:hypothetical protein
MKLSLNYFLTSTSSDENKNLASTYKIELVKIDFGLDLKKTFHQI